jgi:hypothetical protein
VATHPVSPPSSPFLLLPPPCPGSTNLPTRISIQSRPATLALSCSHFPFCACALILENMFPSLSSFLIGCLVLSFLGFHTPPATMLPLLIMWFSFWRLHRRVLRFWFEFRRRLTFRAARISLVGLCFGQSFTLPLLRRFFGSAVILLSFPPILSPSVWQPLVSTSNWVGGGALSPGLPLCPSFIL